MVSDSSVIVTAPSVDEAIIVGLTRLTATRDEVEIEVLDEGSRGFLGIGTREAKVRVTRVERTGGAVTEPGGAAQEMEPAQAPVPEAGPNPPLPPEEDEAAPPPATVSGQAAVTEPEVEAPEVAESAPITEAAAPRAVVPEVTTPAAASKPKPPSRPSGDRHGGRSDGLDRPKLEATARDIMGSLLVGLSVDVGIEWVDEERPTMWVSLDGRDADLLVGPRARNLHAIQYLFRALIYRQVEGNYNVVVDADGYRKRRRRSLESLAKKKADQAVATGTRVRLRAMPAHERRIIHVALRDDDRVSTESVGKGRDRAVTIIPKGPSGSDRA